MQNIPPCVINGLQPLKCETAVIRTNEWVVIFRQELGCGPQQTLNSAVPRFRLEETPQSTAWSLCLVSFQLVCSPNSSRYFNFNNIADFTFYNVKIISYMEKCPSFFINCPILLNGKGWHLCQWRSEWNFEIFGTHNVSHVPDLCSIIWVGIFFIWKPSCRHSSRIQPPSAGSESRNGDEGAVARAPAQCRSGGCQDGQLAWSSRAIWLVFHEISQ